MTTSSGHPALHARRAAELLTAAEAAAWFAAGTPTGRSAIGYALSARAAAWVRIGADGTAEHTGDTGNPVLDAYEMVLFDGDRELRWLQNDGRRGPAVALGEDLATLPPGDDIDADPPPRRGATRTRLLAGKPLPHQRPGWTVLASGRYASTHLPMAHTGGDLVLIETVDYLTEDGHGNIDVADTRTIGLRASFRDAVTVPIAAGVERTRP